MANNPINPNGFSPVSTIAGASWNQQARTYFIPAADTNAYYVGMAVKSATGTDTTNGLPQVQPSTGVTTELQRGVIVGVFVVPPVGNASSLVGQALPLEQTYAPATKTRNYYLAVVDDPQVIFEIQDDGGAASVAANASKNATFTVVAPTSPQQQSATVLTTGAGIATTQGFPLKILGLSQKYTNILGNNYTRYLVKFNQHELLGNTVGI